MMRLWNFVEARFEKYLDEYLTSELHVMRSSLQRYFVVHSVQANRVADALEFLETHVRVLPPTRRHVPQLIARVRRLAVLRPARRGRLARPTAPDPPGSLLGGGLDGPGCPLLVVLVQPSIPCRPGARPWGRVPHLSASLTPLLLSPLLFPACPDRPSTPRLLHSSPHAGHASSVPRWQACSAPWWPRRLCPSFSPSTSIGCGPGRECSQQPPLPPPPHAETSGCLPRGSPRLLAARRPSSSARTLLLPPCGRSWTRRMQH